MKNQGVNKRRRKRKKRKKKILNCKINKIEEKNINNMKNEKIEETIKEKKKYVAPEQNKFNIIQNGFNMFNKKDLICSNCNLKGHIYKYCRQPIISLGLIGFYYNYKNNKIYYLLIRRKDTHGFVEFIRGKWNSNNISYIQRLIDEMTIDEKKKLINHTFKFLWHNLWLTKTIDKKQIKEYNIAKIKFNKLKNGINNQNISISKIIKNSKTFWIEPEWGIPKGKRNIKESNLFIT